MSQVIGDNKNLKRYWSDYITKHSNALDLEKGVFTWDNPRKIALPKVFRRE